MNEIRTAQPGVVPALPAAEAEAVRGFLAEQLAPSTRRAYITDARLFKAWCDERGMAALPASPEVVAAYLSVLATSGARFSTIARKAAAIRFLHETAGFDTPTSTKIVSATLKGIRRSIGVAKVKKAPATVRRISEMARCCGPDTRGLRDRAILLLGFAGAFRRSELVALTIEDLQETEGGLRVLIRKSKTDQEAEGQEIAIRRGEVFCPVAALNAWLAAAGIVSGALFRAVSKSGRVLDRTLTDRAVAHIVKAYAARAGLDPADFSAHSLRAGPITSAAEAGATIFKMQELSRHKTLDVLRGYVRSADLFKNHALEGLL